MIRTCQAERNSPPRTRRSWQLAERLSGAVDVQVDPQVIGTSDAAVLERMRHMRNELVWLYSRLERGRCAARTANPRSDPSLAA
jgi:hypothetical protein